MILGKNMKNMRTLATVSFEKKCFLYSPHLSFQGENLRTSDSWSKINSIADQRFSSTVDLGVDVMIQGSHRPIGLSFPRNHGICSGALVLRVQVSQVQKIIENY